MTLLSRKADYALLIMQYLHTNSSGNAREIAEKFVLSRPFVANILKELGAKGFVSSTRGVKGGYILLQPSATVTLAALLEALEEGFKLTICNDHTAERGTETCDVEHVCPVKKPMTEIHRRLMEVLRGITLADVFTPTGLTQPALETLGIRKLSVITSKT
jgi:Rrf2 family transcriptional regulator, cysteine metabolism repressor